MQVSADLPTVTKNFLMEICSNFNSWAAEVTLQVSFYEELSYRP